MSGQPMTAAVFMVMMMMMIIIINWKKDEVGEACGTCTGGQTYRQGFGVENRGTWKTIRTGEDNIKVDYRKWDERGVD